MQAFSNKKKTNKAKQVLEFIEINFPKLHLFVTDLWNSGKTLQMTLQQAESSLMVDGAFMTADFFSIPIHDALLVKSSDLQRANEHLSKVSFEKLGYTIPLK